MLQNSIIKSYYQKYTENYIYICILYAIYIMLLIECWQDIRCERETETES